LDGTISHQFGRDIPDNSGFFIKNNQLFGSRYTKPELPIFAYNLTNNDSIHYFGSQDRRLTKINQNSPRVFHLFPFKNEIIAVSENEPVIERFDLQGNKTEEIYCPEYFEEYIQHKIKKEEIEKSLSKMTGTASFISNAKLSGKELYLLVIGYDSAKNKVTSKQIFNFTISDSEIKLTRIINLNNEGDHAWYMSFEVFNDKILAFDGLSYQLHEFSLPTQ
jgi:hypothetical protein